MTTRADPISTDANRKIDTSPKRIAIVGSGVAGLAATWALNEYSDHEVVLFESNDYVGGHTHTVNFTKDGMTTPVDSGFIVRILSLSRHAPHAQEVNVQCSNADFLGSEFSDLSQFPRLLETSGYRAP